VIPFASQRASGQDLATHLLNAHDNEQVEVVSIRGAVAKDLHGVFAEWGAVAHNLTRCRKYLYSLSINPDPGQSHFTRDQYEDYVDRVEERLGLTGQPRVIVFHVKADRDGAPREHCHVVWSRVDLRQGKAIQISFDRLKLMMVTREFAHDHDLRLPDGYCRDFDDDDDHHHDQLSLYEKAQQDRTGISKDQRKTEVTKAWHQSDSAHAFVRALEELGYILANGRRPYVLVDRYGETNALPKLIDDRSVRTKDIRECLKEDFPPDSLPNVEEARQIAAQQNTGRENIDAVWQREKHRQAARDQLAIMQAERRQLHGKEKAALLAAHATQTFKLAARQQDDLKLLERSLLAKRKKTLPERDIFRLASVAALLARLPDVAFLIGKIQVRINRRRRWKYLKATTDEGKVEVTVTGHVTDETLSALESAVPEPKRKGFRERAAEFKHRVEKELSPAARRVPFSVPRLVSKIQGELELADPEVFDEFHDWSLLDYPAQLDEGSFTIRDEANTFEIDLDGRKLEISYASQDEQLSLDVNVEGWTENNLALALDKLIADPRFSQSERLKWCLAHVSHLAGERGISLSALWRAKFILARKLTELIRAMKTTEAEKAYQQHLFAPEAKPDVSFVQPFEFIDGMYDGQKPYRGKFKFKKHYLEVVPEIDGGDGGEEFQCAMALESLPEMKHWLRNIAKHPASFRLPLAQGWTYPDFVAELTDGRFLVVEYKGAHLLNDPETREKRLIGELWEKKMAGKGLYIMAVKDDEGKDVRAQLIDKVGG